MTVSSCSQEEDVAGVAKLNVGHPPERNAWAKPENAEHRVHAVESLTLCRLDHEDDLGFYTFSWFN